MMLAATSLVAAAMLGVPQAETVAANSEGTRPVKTSVVRGISGAVEFSAEGATLRAKANQSLTSPILVRVAETKKIENGPTQYRVEFIGAIAGDYDLREYLERHDGSAADVPELWVRVLSQLPPDHGTDLFSTAHAPPLTPTRYKTVLLGAGVIWAAIPVVFLVRRAMNRPAEVAHVPPPPAPSFADQLRPLVQAALDGTLSVAERGRLELLMYLYWRQRLHLSGRQAEVVSTLRAHPEAGTLLRTVEGWLHAPRQTSESAAKAEGEVAALLEPYRTAPALREDGAARQEDAA